METGFLCQLRQWRRYPTPSVSQWNFGIVDNLDNSNGQRDAFDNGFNAAMSDSRWLRWNHFCYDTEIGRFE